MIKAANQGSITSHDFCLFSPLQIFIVSTNLWHLHSFMSKSKIVKPGECELYILCKSPRNCIFCSVIFIVNILHRIPTHPNLNQWEEEKYSKDKIAHQKYSRLLTRDIQHRCQCGCQMWVTLTLLNAFPRIAESDAQHDEGARWGRGRFMAEFLLEKVGDPDFVGVLRYVWPFVCS